MFCHNCGNKIEEGVQFCHNCGKATTETAQTVTPVAPVSNQKEVGSEAIVKCGNCGYIGPGEKARSTWATILAWICVIFAWPVTVIYFVATHKYRCPKCKSTFLGVKNKDGVFAGQKGGATRPLMIVIYVFLGIAVIGIMSSVVLASLNTARSKGTDAKIKAELMGARAYAEVYYDNNSNSYDGVCTSPSGLISSKNNISEASGGDVVCNDTITAYAISSPLKTNTSNSWCVDSTGESKEITGGIGYNTSCYSAGSNSVPTLTGEEMCAKEFPNGTWDGKTLTSDGNYQCSCKTGYQLNAASTACITPNQSCSELFPNTRFIGNNTCDCKTGYTWNTARTACY